MPRVKSGDVFHPEALALARRGAGKSQEQLARELGKSARAVGMWESGERTPSLGVVEQLSALLDVPRGALVTDLVWDPAVETLARHRRMRLGRTLEEVTEELARTATRGPSDEQPPPMDTTWLTVRFAKRVETGERMPPDPAAWEKVYRLTHERLCQAWVNARVGFAAGSRAAGDS